jgi:hypothetical protein
VGFDITDQIFCIHQILSSVTMDNYTIATNYCRKQKQKGGVCIYVKNNIISRSLNLETHSVDNDFEVCGIKLYLKGKKVYILTIFRSPAGNFNKFMKTRDYHTPNL